MRDERWDSDDGGRLWVIEVETTEREREIQCILAR